MGFMSPPAQILSIIINHNRNINIGAGGVLNIPSIL